MNVEQNRLDTFHEWPHNAAISPGRIARAGFFYTNQDSKVECFACGCQIAEWNYGDQAMAKHQHISPTCPFVLNPTTSGNVPIASPADPANTSASMTNEEARLKTFRRWPIPHIVSAESLARAGFYYLKIADNTKCAFCKGVVRAWEPGDNPDVEHKRHFEDCPFVIGEITPRLEASGLLQLGPPGAPLNVHLVTENDSLQQLGVLAHKAPRKPNYATCESRLKTYTRWPPDLIQTPDVLAQAGFYYEGLGDQVRCFHCDGGLRHWDPQDDPWTEHARWFPQCSFIMLVRGQEFITACALEQNVNSNLEEVDVNSISSGTTNPPPISTSTSMSTSMSKKRQVSERQLQEAMTTGAVLSALSIGLNVERVKRALKEKLEQTGRGYSHPDALVEAALNLQHEESADDDEAEDGTPLAVTWPALSHAPKTMDSEESGATATQQEEGQTVGQEQEGQGQGEEGQEATIVGDGEKALLGVSLEEENRLLKEARLCKICMDAEVGIVFLPCGHLTTCVNCAPNLEDCPVCRSAIKATVRTFLS